MSSYQDAAKRLKGDGGQLDGEELHWILKSLEEMETKFQSAFQRMDNAIGGIHEKANEGNGGYKELVDDIFGNFERFEERIIYEIRKSKEEGFVPEPFWGGRAAARSMMVDHVRRREMQYLCEKDLQNETPTNSELLKKIKEKTKELEKMTDDKFSAVFNAFQQIKEKYKRHSEEQGKLKANVQKRFHDHEEFIRTHLPIA